jgi:thioredoxin reductase/ferredoxin
MLGSFALTTAVTGALSGYAPYLLSLVALWGVVGAHRKIAERSARSRLKESAERGGDPVSLHPVIDPAKCVGCGACTHACPEGRIIRMIAGKAELVDPLSCIGHGACKTACPVGAIDLVFGTARRGVDIPLVSPTFESSVPGVYIAGELGGMGLIANAVEQGRQAVEAIARRDDMGRAGRYDLVIVGSGPAGIAATLAARAQRLRSLTLEQETLGGTVAKYPRGKIAMTRPAYLPLYGKVRIKRARKEQLLDLWRGVIARSGITIREGVRVDRITRANDLFEVETNAGPVRTTTVLLATGRRAAPRRLGVPGEALPKVSHGLTDPARYHGQHVLVVGGGNSALEAIAALARQAPASLTLSYRGGDLTRPTLANRQRLDAIVAAGRAVVVLRSNVLAVTPAEVVLSQNGRQSLVRNDAVIICAGGTLPTEIIDGLGIAVERKFGTL